MFERFTERARRVVVLAQEEARILSHNHIGTEHVLLGLIQEGDGVGAKALESLGLSLEDVRKQVVATVGKPGEMPDGHIPFTPRAKKVLELSLREAIQMGHNYIGTEHLLLGIIREGEGVGAKVLEEMGVELSKVRSKVVDLLSGYTESGKVPAEARGQLRRAGEAEGPLCQQCRSPLAETAAFRTILVEDADNESDKISARFLFCTACETSLGMLP